MVKHIGSKEIKTERLVLRKVKISDYKDMFAYFSKEEVSRFVSWKPHKTPKETRSLCFNWAMKSIKKDKYKWVIVFNDKVIGNIDVVKYFDDTAIMGWQLDII